MNFRSPFIQNYLGVGVMRMTTIVSGFISSILLARILHPESYGQYEFAMAFLAILSLPVYGGLPPFITREVSSSKHHEDWAILRGIFQGAHWYVLGMCLILGGIGWIGIQSGLFPHEGKWEIVWWLCLLIPILGCNAIRTGTVKGLGQPALAEIPLQLVYPLLIVGSVSILAFTGRLSLHAMIGVQLVGASITLLIGQLIYRKFKPSTLEKNAPTFHWKQWGSSLLPMTLVVLMNVAAAQIGMVLLGMLGTNESVAVLRISESIARFVALPLVLVNAVIAPNIVKAHKENDRTTLQRISRKSARGAFGLALPIAALLFLLGLPLLEWVYGVEYRPSYRPMVILALAHLFNVTCGSVGQLLLMSGNEKETLYSQGISLLANCVVCWILIPR